MKKLSAVVFSLVLFAGVSFAARGDNSGYQSSYSGKTQKSYSSSSKKSSYKSGSAEHGNFGVGYSKTTIAFGNAFGINDLELDQIAARYWINDTIGIDAQLGFSSGDVNSSVLFGAKVIGKFIQVNKLDIYWMAGLAFGSYDPKIGGVNSLSIFRITGGVGAEYYIIPCLSVLTELGIRYDSASANGNSNSQFGIFADWLPQAGVRFYF